ncbi:hypothetical protein FD754_021493 [Muntiacus muntjak]|uniref:Uncharacterized protein n=1 Tax=Muntiacus muntjak TaxID=9888 RepID=A0A5N3V5X0_MUNMU|nr:hypothetical protein FD754_021493 [Muntiacus muntjak]
MKFGCLSFGQPYVGITLNSVKTLEMWWRPVLCGHWHCTLVVHITQWDWENSAWWEMLEQRLGMISSQIQTLLQDWDKFSSRLIAGLLPDLQQKYMTVLTNPRWLLQPIAGAGRTSSRWTSSST